MKSCYIKYLNTHREIKRKLHFYIYRFEFSLKSHLVTNRKTKPKLIYIVINYLLCERLHCTINKLIISREMNFILQTAWSMPQESHNINNSALTHTGLIAVLHLTGLQFNKSDTYLAKVGTGSDTEISK